MKLIGLCQGNIGGMMMNKREIFILNVLMLIIRIVEKKDSNIGFRLGEYIDELKKED